MRKFKQLPALLLCQGLLGNAFALEIEIGGRTIDLPLPPGFVELTPEMSPYHDSMRAYAVPDNTRHATLIPEDVAKALLRGEDVQRGRYIKVESMKKLSEISISSKQFADFRNDFRNRMDEIYAQAEEQMQEIISTGNSEISKEFAVDLAVELRGTVLLPVHLNSDNAIASSMYLTVGVTAAGEDTGAEVTAATNLSLHVKDKLLFLYVYAPESDLEWTRETSEAWAAAILAANPLSDAEQRALREPGWSIDWEQVLDKAMIGALIGGAFGLASFLFGRRRKQ